MTATLLDVADLQVSYGPVAAVDSVTIDVPEGQVVGLIGPNGAGKTTLIDAITGFTPARSGRVSFAGRDLTGSAAHERARAGLTRTFQSLELFEDLTVVENVLVGTTPSRWWDPLVDAVRPSRSRRSGEVEEALEVAGLADVAHRLPTELSHGRRRTVGLARALASGPKLVLLDEPGAGLDSTETEQLGSQLRRLPGYGTTVLLIDHDMALVMSVCDVVWVLDFGRIIASGPPAEIRRDPAVIAAYLGESAGEAGLAEPDPEPSAP